MTDQTDQQVPPRRVLLCLEGCAGEFYVPLYDGEAAVCPVDREHAVAVYAHPLVLRLASREYGDG